MTLSDLFFLVSFLFCASLVVRLIWLAIRGRWAKLKATALVLGVFVGMYAIALIGTALSMPRRELAAGERKCFDDWCIAVKAFQLQSGGSRCSGAETVWVTTVEVSSDAKRVHQRAADAAIEFEDASGRRYPPCEQPGLHNIRDILGPGESFSVSLPLALGGGGQPAGLVVHHGAFPGLIIIGADQSWLHSPTLFRLK